MPAWTPERIQSGAHTEIHSQWARQGSTQSGLHKNLKWAPQGSIHSGLHTGPLAEGLSQTSGTGISTRARHNQHATVSM
eukprot:scaffold61405_cov21-Tisochrysis_lutea.AAC.2